MEEKDHTTPWPALAQVSEIVGMIFCVAGVMMGLALADSGFLQGAVGLAMGLSSVLPTLAGGLVLIVAGRILRAVIDNSKASAEILQLMRGDR